MMKFLLHFLMLCSFISSQFATIINAHPQRLETSLLNKRTSKTTMQFEAIYQFGDSLSDTGNLVREPTGAKSAFARLPYGQTYFHRPTGRCSDGLLMVDYFGMFSWINTSDYYELAYIPILLEKMVKIVDY